MRQKLIRFEANKSRENILEPGKDLYDRIKGNWHKEYFKNNNPITLEIGCGNGEYTIGLASQLPERNFIGIDVKGDRLFVGSTRALEEKLNNVAFLRTSAHSLNQFFEENEVNELWITFPDPRPKDRDEKRRLTSPRFMNIYRHILHQNGWVKFKTDNTALFEYTLQEIEATSIQVKNLSITKDLYQSGLMEEHWGIQTKYEKIWVEKGEKIKYLKFQFSNSN